MSEQFQQAPSSGALKRKTVRAAAEEAIREKILSGALAPQTRLNEVLLAEELGISRGPLREAIQRLASEGLLEIVAHKGAFVVAVEEAELRQIYELRIALETFAGRKACEQLTEAERLAFRRSLDDAGAAIDEDGPYPSDMDFHRALVGLAQNRVLDQASKDVNARISLARNRSARQPVRAREAFAEHVAIADALVAGDVATATALLEAHLWRSFDNAVALLLR
jgi:DNA-binding GntR family transcriptional regulator